jgi:hypothetical protein
MDFYKDSWKLPQINNAASQVLRALFLLVNEVFKVDVLD